MIVLNTNATKLNYLLATSYEYCENIKKMKIRY